MPFLFSLFQLNFDIAKPASFDGVSLFDYKSRVFQTACIAMGVGVLVFAVIGAAVECYIRKTARRNFAENQAYQESAGTLVISTQNSYFLKCTS